MHHASAFAICRVRIGGLTTISAPVADKRFYDEFFAHRITIAPGDALRVRLKIFQRRDPDIGVFMNESYEVLEVLEHLPKRGKQLTTAVSDGKE